MTTFLDLLYDESPRESFDAVAERLRAAGADVGEVRQQYDVALRLRELVARQRAREAELSALYETAHDLTALRDVNAVLAAIVRRARQLLKADMTYLSLNQEGEAQSYMRVTDGALTAEFERLRLPYGTGLLGLVAQTGAPYFTSDYQADERFVHRGYIDTAVADEGIRAILGVPLVVEGRVIGALLATHRTVRPFPAEEVALLTSFAAHASVALENARLFADLDDAARRLGAQAEAVEAAARAHDELTRLLLHGSPLGEVVDVIGHLLGGGAVVLDTDGTVLAGSALPPDDWADLVAQARTSGRAAVAGECCLAPSMAGPEHLATVLVRRSEPLAEAEVRTLERAAMVVGLVLLLARTVDATAERLGVALLADLLDPDTAERSDRGDLRRRARRQGVRLDGGSSVAVAHLEGVERQAALREAARLARGLDGLAGVHDGRVVLVATGETAPLDTGEALAAALRRAGGTPTVGVAAGPTDPCGGALTAAYAEAGRCVDALLALGRAGETSDPAGLGVARLLLGRGGPDHLEEFVGSTLGPVLGPVLAYDEQRGTRLRETLEAWFAAGGRAAAASSRLHVHPNTVAQRLERVDELLGPHWRDPARGLDLQLALRVHALRRLSTD